MRPVAIRRYSAMRGSRTDKSDRATIQINLVQNGLVDRSARGDGAVYRCILRRLLLAACLMAALSSCAQETYRSARDLAPIPAKTLAVMSDRGMDPGAPIIMRSFKKESEIEIWKLGRDGKYALLKTYPMCRWSGQLGPKVREGDRQAPEGFYDVTAAAMNPKSSLFLSFNIGYPNVFDRSHGRTGSHLMVHGACSSQGCFAMTDEAITEVYAIAREAFASGQRSFQFQSYPFRMTAENLAKHRADPNFAFWKNLKEGSDIFEIAGQEPTWTVSGGRYAFNTDPTFVADISAKASRDERDVAALIAKGIPAIRLVYQDGGGHPSLKKLALAASTGASPDLDEKTRRSLGDVSRPDALAAEPREILIEASASRSIASPRSLATQQPQKQVQGDLDLSATNRPLASGVVTRAAPASVEQQSATASTGATDQKSSFTDRFRSWFAN